MSGEEALEPVKAFMKTIEDTDVYFVLRGMKLRRVSTSQVRTVKIFLALRHFQQTVVTTRLFHALFGTSHSNMLSVLHLLGDKSVLTWVRKNDVGQLRYMLSEKFLEHWNKHMEPKDLNTSSEIE